MAWRFQCERMLREQHSVDADVIICACVDVDADERGLIHVSVNVLAGLHVAACALLHYLVWPALR